jgi:gluconolactonase
MRAIDPLSAALVIQDLQNDVVNERGAFADSGAPQHAAAQNVVENVNALAARCRLKNVPVIHIWYVVERDARGLRQNAPLFQEVKERNALVRGTWGAEPMEGLVVHDNDLVVEKMRMNGFLDTRLASLLRGFGTETLIITGALTNMSVEHTARHSADIGYRTVVASDGTAAVDEVWQRAAIDYALQNVATVATCAEIEAAMGHKGGTT